MSFIDGFFDAINNDRTYSAEDFTRYLSSLICDGILDTYGDCFGVERRNNGAAVAIRTGKAWIKGHYFESDTEYIIDMTEYVDASLDRYVTIAICCDTSEDVRACTLEILPGTPANVPEAVFPQNDTDRTYLTIAAVRLSAASSTPVNYIYDYRSDESRCGYCKCILGKCRVSELMAAFAEMTAQVTQYRQETAALLSSVEEIMRRLGMANYVFPDVNGNGHITADVASRLLQFSVASASGKYSGTEQEKWKAFAEDNGLNGDIFPDVNGDGTIDADDAAIVEAFAAAAGSGKYEDSEKGFRAFMLDYDNAIFGDGISGFRVMTQAQYDRITPKEDIQYSIVKKEASDETE